MIRRTSVLLAFLVMSVPTVGLADKACKDNTQCSDSEMCEKEKGDCATTSMGHCVAKPAGCAGGAMPICGCDGVTYASDCARKMAGTSLKRAGECKETDEQ